MGSLSHIITLLNFNGDVDLHIVLNDHAIPYFLSTSKITNTANPNHLGIVFETESHFPSSMSNSLKMDKLNL